MAGKSGRRGATDTLSFGTARACECHMVKWVMRSGEPSAISARGRPAGKGTLEQALE